jgi:hypothetical protein
MRHMQIGNCEQRSCFYSRRNEPYPPGTYWYFNPFAWQMMFVFAAWCGVGAIAQLQDIIMSRAALVVAVAWLVFAFLIVMTWHVPALEGPGTKRMIKLIYPIDKTDLDMLRFTHSSRWRWS